MENQDNFYNNNLRLRNQQQTSSRADKACSWRVQRDHLPNSPSKKRRNLGDKRLDDAERLDVMYRNALQRDNRVSLWCNDVQRHNLSVQPSSAFTVFQDAPLNQPLPVQPGAVGIDMTMREPSGLLLSPFQQSMNMPTLINSTAMNFTSAHLRSPEMTDQRFPETPRIVFNNNQFPGFNLDMSQPSRLSRHSPSPWSTNTNALQLRDTNQHHVFHSGFMMHKPNDIAVKHEDTCKPDTTHNQDKNAPTWSQVAAGNPQAFHHRASSTATCSSVAATATSTATATATATAAAAAAAAAAVNANNANFFTVKQESSIMVKEDMDINIDIQDATFTPAVTAAAAAATTTAASMDPHVRESRYITDSLAFISSGVNNDQNISVIRPYAVLKIKNISWNVSASDVYDTLSRYKILKLPDVKKLSQCIHILMDVKTGKTLNTAYVELEINAMSATQMDSIIRNINIPQAQGRHISICRSSYDELCNDLFSGWRGQFTNGTAYPHTDSRDSSAIQKSQYYIGQKDLQRLLNVCRFFKTYYNRKCAERPFEYLITIVMNMPWKQPRAVTTAQRDIIYECYKLAIEALHKHISRPYHSFDDELLPRMVRAAVVCDGFTVKQKKVVLNNANMDCPKDLDSYMEEPILNSSGLTAFLR